MSDLFRIYRGLELDDSVQFLTGIGAPGLTYETNIAPVASFYTNQADGGLWTKVLPGSGSLKWRLLATQEYVQSLLSGLGGAASWRAPVVVIDTASTVLPVGVPASPITVDGVSITDGQRVLFSGIIGAGGPNVYVYDQLTGTFVEDTRNETDGDTVFVQAGSQADSTWQFNGTTWVKITTGTSPPNHGSLTGLGADDHTQYVHVSIPRTVTAQHTFSPASSAPPFILGTNAQGQLVTGLNADFLDGLHASAFQPVDADLTAVSNLTTIGFAVRSGTDTWVTRSILGTAGNISVTNGSGATGNTVINLIGTGIIPGTYTKLTVDTFGRATAGSSPTTLAEYGILDAQPLNEFLTSISGATSSGIMVKSGTSLFLRSISAASPKLTVSNGDGVPGNITVDLGTVNLDDLTDAVISSPAPGQTLIFNGTNWVNQDVRLKLYAENPVSPAVPTASGANSIALGSEAEAAAANSLAFGQQSLARYPGITQANGRFGSQGDAQVGRYILRSTSINASQTELFLDGTGGSQRLTLPSDSTWMFNITVVGHRTDAMDGHAGYKISGVVFRQGTINTALLGAPTKQILSETDPAWDAFVEVNHDSLVVKAIGEMGKTIRWMALVETVEITN